MSEYVVGQRVVSEAEPELGLGVVHGTAARRVAVLFPASETVRYYATASAPLKRVLFRVGDTVSAEGGEPLVVEEVDERDGLLYYRGNGQELSESELDGALRFSKPEERLLGGLWDPNPVFSLRRRALSHRYEHRRSPARGFLGGRVALLPHQIYIAQEVANRPIPRALLADEVGLGKTIEAGLILHRLVRSGQVNRVLILVPESLIHQWFFEMYRRFHLSFSLVDEAFCESVEAGQQDANPFEETQLVISALNLASSSDRRREQMLAAGWDMVVVDEAHRLGWSATTPGEEYQVAEALARTSPGLLLLTATPEQLGEKSHFAHLRLLDPGRYVDFETYQAQTSHYRTVADVASRLLEGEALSSVDRDRLDEVLPPSAVDIRNRMEAAATGDANARAKLMDDLLDLHGPGRVLFRNSRRVLQDFPERRAELSERPWPRNAKPLWISLARELVTDTRDTGLELTYEYRNDPRVDWLIGFLREHRSEKVLLICRFAKKAVAIYEALRQTQLSVALFHEDMTLLQRDRNAAWFGDEEGAQVLVSSEIGSEGRNFQFAHHLVFFDWPMSPDLVEQRIGRLDRIGQWDVVQIHLPFLPGSGQEILMRWFHEGLSAIETSLPVGHRLASLAERARELALSHVDSDRPVTELPESVDELLEETREARDAHLRELEEGRDRLLEMSSFRSEVADVLLVAIREAGEDTELDRFLQDALDYLGVEIEELSERTFLLRQGNRLIVDRLPGLRGEETSLTLDREKALHREELGFLTWDHPLIDGLLELLLGGEHGNASVAIWPGAVEPGLYLEAVFVLDAVAPPSLYVDRFLPPTPLRVVFNEQGDDVTEETVWSVVERRFQEAKPLSFGAPDLEDTVSRLIAEARGWANRVAPHVCDASVRTMKKRMGAELDRLRALKELNDHVREEEIDALGAEIGALENAIQSASVRLDALRLILATSEKRPA